MASLLRKQQCTAFAAEEFGKNESPGKCRNESPEIGRTESLGKCKNESPETDCKMLVTRLSLMEVRNGLLLCARQFFISRLVVDEQYLV